ncbi:putative P-loop containing nucleoside triphosphate hydrolase [Helianthus annuus]|uniref:P-loop containing nucleoside triphosphate hydrolase n=1 Tax=Helianthus annuus TaxID=4232 RepID=A0A251VGK7_HELAN|nr:uncharacterized protein LOC110922451 isoform X2 [Helianthus annuus]KAF5819186.1 putative P-loop containing nucleoside triphosphate hydrolase [Helianthus annuus]KAJ0605378.1 putative P-loop containing nucleoside triphosphate hydrolase [Helianthus annuus]KAJ0616166.1 putative P-loop containing nucleoside triphosphate hydrolase [Helianthus annuus]KAJ0619398.1 putative P-loop containing nucleoside triphosphate hydrolase [Helianthus annuus]KAJ0777848.1 putative P-loop containing nucleoside triph
MTNLHSSSSSPSPFCWWKSIPEFSSHDVSLKPPSSSSSSTPSSSIMKVFREMERLCLISEHGVDDLKHKLMIYKSGDFWVPVGGIKKEDMDIPQVITVLLVGLSGSGKSSLINLMYSVVGRSGFIPFTQTSNEASNYSTMILEEHNVLRSTRNGFCVYDSRGLDCNRMDECLKEVTRWMTDGVRHNESCRFGEEDVDVSVHACYDGYVRRRVNYVMVVADLMDVYKAFFCGGDFKPVVALKSLFHCPSIKTSNVDPILILTHGDMLQPTERLNCRIKICSYLGIPVTTGAYDIVCLTEQGILADESDSITSFALTEAIYRSLLQSDQTHLPKKTYKDWTVDVLSRSMCSLACFFDMLSRIFQKWGYKYKTT